MGGERAPKELRHAVRAGNLELVKKHVVNGKYKDAISNPKVGSTILFASAQCGHAKVAEHLIDGGADVNTSIKSGASALYTACFRGHTEVIDLLLKHGAEVNRAKADGATPLFAAAQQNKPKAAKMLMAANADTSLAMKASGTTPALIAEKNGHLDIIEIMNNADSDKDKGTAKTKGGKAPEPEPQAEEAVPEEAESEEEEQEAKGTAKTDGDKKRIHDTFKTSKYMHIDDIDEEEQEHAYRMMESVTIQAGNEVLTQGDVGEYYYGIEDGECEVLVDGNSVAKLPPGICFGEISLIHGTPCAATIRVTKDATLWRLEQETFNEVRVRDGEGFVEKTEEEKKRIDATFATCRWIDFKTLANPSLLYTSIVEETREPGEGGDLITQGQEGLFFYGIEDGECEVLVNGKHVAEMGSGSSFGELALMNKTKCAATIRVTKPCKLWKLDRDTFDILLMRNANNQLGRLKSFLTHVALLSSLENEELESVAEQLKTVKYNADDTIIEEGDDGDSLYIMDEGTARATKKDILNDDGEPKVLMEYEKGEWFGELALMGDAKRSATIKAVDSVKCLQLPRKTFEAFMGKCEDIVKRDKKKYEQVNAALKIAQGIPETPRSQSARQAGRIDGSMEFLAELQSLPGGMTCADCGDAKPTWGSSNTGALICLACSGVHRLIGAHNSKMLSVKLDAWEPELVENMKEGNDAVNARLEKLLKPEDKPKPGCKREDLEDFVYSKYAAKNFSEGGNGKLEVFPERKDEKRSESNIGMIVMIGVVFTSITSVTGVAGDVVEGQIVGAPRPGVTRNKPKKQKKDLVWNEMIQLQASQGAVEARPNTLNLSVKKGKKVTGVAFQKSDSKEPGIDLSELMPDVPMPYEAVLKVQDKKKGWVEKGSIKITANFALIDQ